MKENNPRILFSILWDEYGSIHSLSLAEKSDLLHELILLAVWDEVGIASPIN